MVPSYDPNRCIQNDLICYKLSCCIRQANVTHVVKDQFNKEGEERKLVLSTNTNTFEMCTPAWKINDNDNIIVNEPCRSECCEQLDKCTKVRGRCMRKCEDTTMCPVETIFAQKVKAIAARF